MSGAAPVRRVTATSGAGFKDALFSPTRDTATADGKSTRGGRRRSEAERHGVPSLQCLSRNFEFLSREVRQLSTRGEAASSPPSLALPEQQQQRPKLPLIRELSAVTPRILSRVRNGPPFTSRTRAFTHFVALEERPVAVSPAVASNKKASAERCVTSDSRRPLSGTRAATSSGSTRGGRIRVVVRKRPMEPGDTGTDAVLVNSPWVHVSVKRRRVDLTDYEDVNDFMFDSVFAEDTTNAHLFDSCGNDLIVTALAGGSASCFAYGQTGSGKTHTMQGNQQEKGLYLLAAVELFMRLPPEHEVHVALYEIYSNSLFDLLNGRVPVTLREDHHHRMNICGLSWHNIASAEALQLLIGRGTYQRRTGSTSANECSSRSHAVLTIRILHRRDASFCGTLNFVDLAGSERASDTAAEDQQTRREGAEINKSLLALKECIRALDEKKKHVPFRGSKLTEILRDSFMGNSRTVMIANISASSCNYEHTVNTLRYAFRVKGLSVASVVPSKARNAPRPVRQNVCDFSELLNFTNDTAEDAPTQRAATPLRCRTHPHGVGSQVSGNRSRRPNMSHPNAQGSNMIVSPPHGMLLANENTPRMNLHAMAHEKVLNLIPLDKLREKLSNTDDISAPGSADALASPSGGTTEQQQVLEIVNQVVDVLKLEMEPLLMRGVRRRDCLIRKLRSENIALRAIIATLGKRAEECKYCRRQLGETLAAPITL
ncbi:mitotic centromere-associated kinesin (MCAK) [Trypanosoma rangeli]|uniref:Kinesin-like protein n=1 Tax=Trypanosoma rangeli TaxID=5698 RepID=A0A422P055_TRYRA|nr:mitotic centromere-associated kinesin (MCAK) [Trypanosoma rangeli]RNF11065.1 mitotic centromere-associated kinesin (MCAK) [Trypanosoma rangeli]|eukprot:RNF11065.1 mitotic centromere-associated kinesin (MCAK) [Trypanosoma rangeli]